MSNYVFLIPIRSGSKGLKDKNIKPLAGKPLVFYSIDVILAAGFLPDSIYISSDSDEYLLLVKDRYPQVQLLQRPHYLAEDDVPTSQVIVDWLNRFEDDQNFVLTQATTPLKTAESLCQAIDCYERAGGVNPLVSMKAADEPVELFTSIVDGKIPGLAGLGRGYRRQTQKRLYLPNGAFYIDNKARYLQNQDFFTENTLAYLMNAAESVDIDTEVHFKMCESLLAVQKQRLGHVQGSFDV